ncbi:MAG: alpha/beta hydrolase, partial [Acidimicrobiaceae bacterium]|nr:alpha/beta hydrolase [Acidimicrobiaceae bacterium]
MRVAFDHLSREELDWQLSPSKSARDAAGVLQRLETETEELATAPGVRCTLDVAYGPGPRQKMDLYRPHSASDPIGCLVFIHGGFWQRGSKMWSGFPARCLTGSNWALVGVGYTLAPEASLAQIVEETALALSTLARRAGEFGLDRDRIVLAGHSAGAHLSAAILSGMGGEDAAQLPAR